MQWVADEPGPLESVTRFTKRTAGAETNVAVGLARLGLPDLEMHGVSRAELRARGERFRAVWDALRVHGFAKPGDVVGGATLRPCLRPPEVYDHQCVRVE